MLKFRARWALRYGFADVLKGLHLREEMEDMEAAAVEAVEPTRRAPPPPEQATTVETTQEPVKKDDPISSGPAERRAPPPPTDEPKQDNGEETWLANLAEAFADCAEVAELSAVQTEMMTPQHGKVSDATWKKAVALINEHLKRVQTG